MKLTLSPKFSFGLAAVLLSFAINAATQEEPDPSRIVASIYDGSLKTHGAAGALWSDSRDRQATLSKALKTLWDRPIRGGHNWSQHAYGNAVDLEALGFTSTKEFTSWQRSHGDAIRAAAEHWGMKWGGDMRRKDTPHYEWGGVEGTHRHGLDANARKHMAPGVVKHEGHAKVSVDFRGMPRGVKVAGKPEGIFKEVRLNRGRASPIAEG